MRSILKITFAMALVAFVASPALAADGEFSFGSNIGYSTLTGDDFEAADAGFGINGSLRYKLENNFGVNGALQWNKHGVEGTDGFSILTIAVEPRYHFALQNPQFTPFVGARGMWAKNSGDSVAGDVSASGFGFGGVAGMIYQVSSQFGIEVNASYDALSFGDFEVDGTTMDGTDSSGGAFSFATGFVYNFPN